MTDDWKTTFVACTLGAAVLGVVLADHDGCILVPTLAALAVLAAFWRALER